MSDVPIDMIQKRDNYICQYCGKDGLASLDNWHDCCVDHFIPLSRSGKDDATNKVTSCGYCNQIKGNRLFGSMDEAREFVRQRRQQLEENFRRVLHAVRG